MKALRLIEKAFFLKKNLLFGDLDLDLLVSIADKMEQEMYPSGKTIFQADQIGHLIYWIIMGNVEIRNAQGLILKELQPNDFFGEESLFNEKPRTYSAICKGPCHLLTLSRASFLSSLSECPSIAIALLQSYAQAIPCRNQ